MASSSAGVPAHQQGRTLISKVYDMCRHLRWCLDSRFLRFSENAPALAQHNNSPSIIQFTNWAIVGRASNVVLQHAATNSFKIDGQSSGSSFLGNSGSTHNAVKCGNGFDLSLNGRFLHLCAISIQRTPKWARKNRTETIDIKRSKIIPPMLLKYSHFQWRVLYTESASLSCIHVRNRLLKYGECGARVLGTSYLKWMPKWTCMFTLLFVIIRGH